MAKYTETLAEYLQNGGVLPSASFALMGDDFEELFIERFIGSEIGFETEELFRVRLNNKAALVCPLYADKLAAVASSINSLKTPSRWQYEKRTYGKAESSNESDGKNTDLPYDADTAKPSFLNHIEGKSTLEEHTDETNRDESITVDEELRIMDAMKAKEQSVKETCLEEFKPLFMRIY